MANPRCYKCEVTSYYLSGSFVPQGLLYPGQMHLCRALLCRRDYFARPDVSHHWKAIAKNISARPFRQIHIFLHQIKEKIFSLLTFLPSFAFILPYSKAVIDMFKGFQIGPGLVYYIPLNIIRIIKHKGAAVRTNSSEQ